ncbi:MAG: site-specific integrase [Candidatus Bathyarchaeia archaeon]
MKAWEEFLKVNDWRSDYQSVDTALRHYARKVKSEKTRENFCITLMFFCKHCGLDPEALVKIEPNKASKLCQKFTDALMEKGYSIRYVNVSQAYLKTFFRENGFTAERELKVERYHQPTRYRKKPEYVPTPEEIHRMGYASGSAKNRAMIFALYTSGLRNSTLRALKYRDIKKELEAGLSVVKIPVYPEMKQVDPAACKGDIPYFTFIDSETVKALKEYLEERRQQFGGIAEEEPLFCSDSNQVPKGEQNKVPVSKNGLEKMVKRAAKQARIAEWRNVTPKCLRKAYESALRNNRLDPKDQEFLMGHILPGTQDAYYDYSKVESLRAKYSAIKFFRTAEMDKLEMIKAFAQTLGIGEIEVKIQKMKEKQGELDEMAALGKVIREELGLKPLETRMVKYRKEKKESNGDKDCKKYETKMVSESELLPYLDEGWDIIKELEKGRIVIRRKLHNKAA